MFDDQVRGILKARVFVTPNPLIGLLFPCNLISSKGTVWDVTALSLPHMRLRDEYEFARAAVTKDHKLGG